MRMTCIQLWGFHDDAVQIPNPVGMNTWLYTWHHQKNKHQVKIIFPQNYMVEKDPEPTFKASVMNVGFFILLMSSNIGTGT